MGRPPYFYDIYDLYNAHISPSTVHVKNSELSFYFRRYLLQRAMSVFKWEFPEDWDERAKIYFLYGLYCFGFMAIIKTDKFGVIPQHCTLTGYDVFYQPTNVMIQNPLINTTVQPRIDVQCALIKLQPDYGGILDIGSYYADQLALLAEAVGVNAINSKLSFAFGSSNKAAAESFKKMFDEYASGEPAVFYDKQLLDPKTGELNIQFINNDVRNSYIITDLLADIRTVMNHFDTDIGIPNANLNKRERMLADEIAANDMETKSLCELWLDSLRAGCEKAKELFDINMSVEWRVVIKGGNIAVDDDIDTYGDPASIGKGGGYS